MLLLSELRSEEKIPAMAQRKMFILCKKPVKKTNAEAENFMLNAVE